MLKCDVLNVIDMDSSECDHVSESYYVINGANGKKKEVQGNKHHSLACCFAFWLVNGNSMHNLMGQRVNGHLFQALHFCSF